MTTAIFLGAGASAAEGAPLQNDLFRECCPVLLAQTCPVTSHPASVPHSNYRNS
jgi:hypothetical protein